MMSLRGLRTLAAGLAVLLLGSVALASDCCPPACPVEGPCCQEVCKKVCVPHVEQVKKATPIYRMKCEDLCLPRCSLRAIFSAMRKCGHDECCPDDCGCEECQRCGKPREVRRLVKKFETEEACKVKCKVEHRLECEPVKVKKYQRGCPVECCDAVVVPAPPAAEPIAPPAPKNP